MKKFWEEFKAFALKGNMMDMGKKEEAPAEPEAPAAPTQEELLASILEELKKQNEEKSA